MTRGIAEPLLFAADEFVCELTLRTLLMHCFGTSFTTHKNVALPRLLTMAYGAEKLQNGSVSVIDGFMGKASQIQAGQLARETIALVITSVFAVERIM